MKTLSLSGAKWISTAIAVLLLSGCGQAVKNSVHVASPKPHRHKISASLQTFPQIPLRAPDGSKPVAKTSHILQSSLLAFYSAVRHAMQEVARSTTMPLVAPAGANFGAFSFVTLPSHSEYVVTLHPSGGAMVNFGGQHYSTIGISASAVNDLILGPSSTGTRITLQDGAVVWTYEQRHLITWAQDNWIIQVSAAPHTLSWNNLLREANVIASAVRHTSLPDTILGVMTWTDEDNLSALSMNWLENSNAYFVNEPESGNISPVISVISSMRPFTPK